MPRPPHERGINIPILPPQRTPETRITERPRIPERYNLRHELAQQPPNKDSDTLELRMRDVPVLDKAHRARRSRVLNRREREQRAQVIEHGLRGGIRAEARLRDEGLEHEEFDVRPRGVDQRQHVRVPRFRVG